VNIRLYLQVVRRHLIVLCLGLAATVGLAVYAVKSAKPTWQSASSLLATQTGASIGAADTNAKFDPTRLTYLVAVYSQLATSDAVRRAVVGSNGSFKGAGVSLDGGRVTGGYTADQLSAADGSTLPILEITATSPSRSGAAEIGARVSDALKAYLVQQQNAANTPASNRIQLAVVAGSGNTKIAKSHKKTLPAIILVLGLIGTFALIFFLENLKTYMAATKAAAEADASASPPDAATVRLDDSRRIASAVPNGAETIREDAPRERKSG
jgi:capsular polysaccharide biosynthesis protein